MPKTVNEILLDRTILHATRLERLRDTLSFGYVGRFNAELLKPLTRRTERFLGGIAGRDYDTTTAAKIRRFDEVNRKRVRAKMRELQKALFADLAELAAVESVWQVSLLAEAIPLEIVIGSPSPALLRSIVRTKPMEGRLLKKWWSDIAEDTQARVTTAINRGLVNGDTTDSIVRAIKGRRKLRYADGLLQSPRRHIETIVRTAVNDVATRAREMVFEDNDDLLKEVRYVATLDASTTVICASLDGQVFKVGDGPRPPMHMQCRSTVVPIVPSFKELGKELGIELRDIPPSTRASMDGQVAETLKYPDWLRGQTVKVQNEVLGKGRAELWRAGKVKFENFVDSKAGYRSLSLAELRKLEGV